MVWFFSVKSLSKPSWTVGRNNTSEYVRHQHIRIWPVFSGFQTKCGYHRDKNVVIIQQKGWDLWRLLVVWGHFFARSPGFCIAKNWRRIWMLGKTVLFFLYQQMNLNMDIATVFFLTTSNQVIKWLNYDQVDGWFYSLLVTNMTNEIQIIALSSLVGGLEHLKNQIHSLGNGKSSQLTNFVHHFSEG